MTIFTVKTPAGSSFEVLTQEEVQWYNDIAERYQKDNHFSNVTDLQDLDRIMSMELMIHRWNIWISQDRDYYDEPVDVEALSKSLKEFSTEIRQTKKTVGLDKFTRDKEKGESVSDYLENLKFRAKEFGVMREDQLIKGITLVKEFQHLYGLYNRCVEEERDEPGGITLEGLFQWIDEVFIPEFDAIDLYFQEHSQKFWIREI